MANAARFFLKVYNSTGATVRTTIDSGSVSAVGPIVREVGKLAGALDVRLALPWDDFGYGSTINLFDLVKVYAVNPANSGGLVVFQGHIVEIDGQLDQGQDSVTLRLHPLDALLNNAHYKSGATASLADYTVAFATTDVDAMFSAIITDANTVYGSFFSSSLGNPALSMDISFIELTHFAALQKAAALLDETWYWRINAAGQVKLAQWAATATHRLTLGKDVASIRVVKTIVDLKNGELLKWGATPTRAFYNDAGSQTSYGKRQRIVTDSGIDNSGTADQRGAGDLARLDAPLTKTVIRVNTEYAIETILPGDTVQVFNVTNGTSQMVTGVLKVARIAYDGATCLLTIADSVQNYGAEFAKAIGSSGY